MEKDGLITRIQNSPKSTLLRLELTKKGLDVLKISRPSTSIDKIFSSLSKEEREQVELILKRILIQAKEFTKT
jgi:DNA-binding MarR family transcriptional regulator